MLNLVKLYDLHEVGHWTHMQ